MYKMFDSFIQQDVKDGLTHTDDEYVHLCAETDLMHYQLQGLPLPEQISVEVKEASDARILRTITVATSSLISEKRDFKESLDKHIFE